MLDPDSSCKTIIRPVETRVTSSLRTAKPRFNELEPQTRNIWLSSLFPSDRVEGRLCSHTRLISSPLGRLPSSDSHPLPHFCFFVCLFYILDRAEEEAASAEPQLWKVFQWKGLIHLLITMLQQIKQHTILSTSQRSQSLINA